MNHTMNALSALLQRNEGEAKTDDYTGEDGLLHCGKCHAPRQMHAPDYIRKTTGESVVWIPCDCEANERATLRQHTQSNRLFGCFNGELEFSERQWTEPADGICPELRHTVAGL